MKELIRRYASILEAFPLFRGLSEEKLLSALTLMNASCRSYEKDETVSARDGSFSRFGLVLEGQIRVYSDDADGAAFLMASVGPGKSFGESLCILKRSSDVRAISTEASRILWLNPELPDKGKNALAAELAERFTLLLAERTLTMNSRIQILSRHSLRAKLMALLSEYGKADGRPFTLPLSRQAMADYLGCDRSALSRELSRMKDDGLLDYHISVFKLLPQ